MSVARHDARGAARGVAADLGTTGGCAALVTAEPSADILVNNVGVFGPRDFFDTPGGKWERSLAVSVMSGVRLSRAYVPRMAALGWGGWPSCRRSSR